MKSDKNYFKFLILLVVGLLIRLIPFRAPNVEPILAMTMPLGRALGAFSAFSFAVLSIIFYDFMTHTFGVQTFFTLSAYGILGLWSASYFKKNNGDKWSYVRFAVMGTLFFDAATGLTVGPLFFHQSFLNSFLGQIPFTLLHLLGNVTFAYFLSPIIYHYLIRKKKENMSSINILNPKTI